MDAKRHSGVAGGRRIDGALIGPGTAEAGPDKEKTGRHVLGDQLVDAPKEAEAARLAGPGLLRAQDDDGQHGGTAGHIPGSSKNVKLVSKLDVSGAVGGDREGHIADVTVHDTTAYLAARRLNTTPCGTGGFYAVDISKPDKPKEISFTPFPAG